MGKMKKKTFRIDFGSGVQRYTLNVSSTYTIETRPGFLCLTDLDLGRTLTNNAAIVISDLQRDGYDLEKNRVIYRDTDGIWDEMLVADKAFSGFKPINCTDLDTAIQAAISRPKVIDT